MKRLFTLVLLVLMLAILVPGCGGGVETYTDSGQAITVKVGQEFIIALGSNLTTGYGWQESYDPVMLKLVEKKYVPDETEEELVGAGGVEYFRFRALKPGSTRITLDYQRPWEGVSAEQKVFAVNIK